MEARDLAVALAGARIAIGAVSLLMPGVAGRAMIGVDAEPRGARVVLRVLGARDLALGVGVLAALERDAPVRGWLRASAVADGLDAVGSLLARNHLRRIVFPAVAGAARPEERCSAAGWPGGSTHRGGWTASGPPSSVGAAPRARSPATYRRVGSIKRVASAVGRAARAPVRARRPRAGSSRAASCLLPVG